MRRRLQESHTLVLLQFLKFNLFTPSKIWIYIFIVNNYYYTISCILRLLTSLSSTPPILLCFEWPNPFRLARFCGIAPEVAKFVTKSRFTCHMNLIEVQNPPVPPAKIVFLKEIVQDCEVVECWRKWQNVGRPFFEHKFQTCHSHSDNDKH